MFWTEDYPCKWVAWCWQKYVVAISLLQDDKRIEIGKQFNPDIRIC